MNDNMNTEESSAAGSLEKLRLFLDFVARGDESVEYNITDVVGNKTQIMIEFSGRSYNAKDFVISSFGKFPKASILMAPYSADKTKVKVILPNEILAKVAYDVSVIKLFLVTNYCLVEINSAVQVRIDSPARTNQIIKSCDRFLNLEERTKLRRNIDNMTEVKAAA